mgnify:CR=1 FL=1
MKISMQKNSESKTIQEGFQEFIRYKKANNIRLYTEKDYEMTFSIFAGFFR